MGEGAPGSARLLGDLSLNSADLPAGTPEQAATVRRALRQWEVGEVVVTGTSADPVYASGFLTSVLGRAPVFVQGAWVWTIRPDRSRHRRRSSARCPRAPPRRQRPGCAEIRWPCRAVCFFRRDGPDPSRSEPDLN